MRRSAASSWRHQLRHTLAGKTLGRSARGGLLLFLAGALGALAGTPANLQEGLQAQRALVAENPYNADLLNDLGNLLALAGDFEEAEEIYRRALAVDPDDITANYNLALVLTEQGQTKEALKILKSILEVDPTHAWTHYQLGSLYAEQRNRTKAVQHYAEAFSLDRSLTSVKVNPHIVENRLATEALLTMHVDEAPSTQAPRIYKEPGNVADLLLPRQTAEPAVEPVTETAPEAMTEPVSRQNRTSTGSPTAFDDLETETEEPAEQDAVMVYDDPSETRTETEDREEAEFVAAPTRRIDASTIETQQSDSAGSTAGNSQTGSRQSTGSVTRSSPPSQPMPSAEESTFEGDAISTPSSYIPGVQSTGRLEIELLPAAEGASATSPT